MRIAQSLYMQTLGMVLLYLTTLTIIVFIGFNAQFGVGWEALLKSPFGDRIDTIADAVSSNLRTTDSKNWNDILKNYDKIYNADFYVFNHHGEQLAGKSLELPKELREKVIDFPPMPPFGPHPLVGPQLPFGPHPGLGAPPGMPPFNFRFQRAGLRENFTIQAGPPPPLPGHELKFPPIFHAEGRFVVHTQNPDMFYIGTKVLLFDVEHMRPMPSFVIAATPSIWQSTLLFDFRFLLLTASLIVVLSLAFWWPFVYHIVKAISELTTVTEKIAEGNFEVHSRTKRSDEVGRLSDAVNVMANRLNEYVSAQKRFLADISHELYSPLARLHMALELLEDCAEADAPRHFQEINEEIDEMRSLINELLAYSKAGMTRADTQLSRVDLQPILDDVARKFAEQSKIDLALAPNSVVEGDPLLLSRSFSNIIRNSVRYAGDAGPISIASAADGENITVTFLDCGPGVPEESIQYLGQPFFRPEFSRNRNVGGFGLGLAIVKSCVQACNGTVTLLNRPEGGLQVRIRLKAAT